MSAGPNRRAAFFFAGALGVALSQSSSLARAQARSVPMGGRAATMGGTGVAEGHDISAPLVNPAGVAAVDSQVFGLSSSLYSYSFGSVSNFFAPTGFSPAFGQVSVDTQTYGSSNFAAVPSGVAVFRHVGPAPVDSPGHLVLGIAALSPIAYNQQADARLHASLDSTNGFIDRQTGLTERALDLYVGPVAGLVLSPRLRIGLSLMGLYRNRYLLATTTMTDSQEAGNDFASYRGSWLDESTSFGAVAVAGIQLEVIDHLWAGASVQSPSVQLTGSEHQTRAETVFLNAPPVTAPTNIVDQETADLRYSSVDPPRIAIGAAYDLPEAFALAADVTYVVPYPGIDDASGTSATAETISGSATRNIAATYNRTIDGLSRVDFSVGAEAYVTPNLALRGGFSEAFDPRALPPLGADTVFTTRRNLSTVTAGLGLVLGPFDTTAGVAWQHATGTIDVEDLFGSAPSATGNYPGYARLDLTENTFMFLLSGTISEKEAVSELVDRLKAVTPAGALIAAAEAAVHCPKVLDPSEIARFDYAGALHGHEADARSIQGSLAALAELEDLAARVEATVTEACRGLAQDLGRGGDFGASSDACAAASQGIADARARLGAARWAVEVTPPVCSVSVDQVAACLAQCGEAAVGGAADLCSAALTEGAGARRCNVQDLTATHGSSCAASCSMRAFDAIQCTTPRVHLGGTAAAPELAAVERHLPGLLRATASLPSHAAAVLSRARDLVAGVQSTARLLGDGDADVVAMVAACVITPAVTALSSVEGLVSSLASASSVTADATRSP